MAQKIIKVDSSSAGVIIPFKELHKLGLKIGDAVKVTVKSGRNGAKVVIEYDPFAATYRQALKDLAGSNRNS